VAGALFIMAVTQLLMTLFAGEPDSFSNDAVEQLQQQQQQQQTLSAA